MTRKFYQRHYIMVARLFHERLSKQTSMEEWRCVNSLMAQFEDMFAADSSKFDRLKFELAIFHLE
jgi:hypothetical protein